MATWGNCGTASGSGFGIYSSKLFLIYHDFTIASWVRISQLGFSVSCGYAGESITWRYAFYKKAVSPSGGTLVWLSSEYTLNFPTSGQKDIDTPIDFYLAPGTYWFAIVVCSTTCDGLGNASGGTSYTAYRFPVSACITPPSPLGTSDANGSQTFRHCITYDTVTTGTASFITAPNQRVCLDFDPISPLEGLDENYEVPCNLTLPNPSTFTVTTEVHPYDWDYDSIGPSSIVTTGSSYSIRWQEKCFYVAGRYWVFWSDSDNHMYYSTSTDGLNWTNKTDLGVVNYRYGETCGVIYDGTYFHVHNKKDQDLWIRIGTPNPDGSITWLAAANKMHSGTGAYIMSDHSYIYGTNKVSWNAWHYGMSCGAVSCLDCYVNNNSPHDVTTDGLWSGTLYPAKFSDTDYRGNMLRALPGGKVLMLVARVTDTLKEFFYNGTSWSGAVAATLNGSIQQYSSGGENWAYDAVVDKFGNVHLSYLDSSYRIWYGKRDYATGAWLPERLLFSGSRYDHDTKIVYDEATGDLYVFIAHAPSLNHIGFCRYDAQKNVWYPMIDFIDASVEGLAPRSDSGDWGGLINTSNIIRGNRIPIIYIVTGNIIKCKVLVFKTSYLQYQFKQREDSSTNPSRTIEFTGSTFSLEYDKYQSCSETRNLQPWLRVNHKIPTVILHDFVAKGPRKFLEELLEMLPFFSQEVRFVLSQSLFLIETISNAPEKTFKEALQFLDEISLNHIIPYIFLYLYETLTFVESKVFKVKTLRAEVLHFSDLQRKRFSFSLTELFHLADSIIKSPGKHLLEIMETSDSLSSILYGKSIKAVYVFATILLGKKRVQVLLQKFGVKVGRE